MRWVLSIAVLVAVAVVDIWGLNTLPPNTVGHPQTYVVIAPSKIRPGVNCAVSVNILKAAGGVNVNASIVESSGKEIALSNGVFQQGLPGELIIKLPKDLPRSSFRLVVQGTGNLTFKNSSPIGYERKAVSIFIQTDKAMYKPGDTVNFRVLAVYPDLKPYNGRMDISISDASSNKIRQLMGVSGREGVFTHSLSLSSQPVLGDWKINVMAKESSQSKVFTIDEYVLPKFEVDVAMPSYVLSSDKDVTFTVNTKYTYGMPVKGKLDIAVKMHYSYNDYDTSRDLPIFTTTKDIDGQVKVTMPMSAALAITKYINGRILTVRANVTESLTGNTLTSSGTVHIYQYGHKLEFPGSNPNTFKPGLKYVAYLKVSQQDGRPVPASSKKVIVSTRVSSLKDPMATQPPNQWWWSPQIVSTNLPDVNLTVPVNGLVEIPIDVPANAKDVYITAKYDHIQASKNIAKMYSPSSSYMQLSINTVTNIQAGSSISFEVKATQPLGQVVYQILSRGQIVDINTVDGHGQTSVTFALTASSAMAPNARIVAYYVRSDGEIVTDSISFDVDGIFKNKVGISINQTEAEPGEPVKVTVTADANSHAYILAVDQSVLLLKSGNDITADDVNAELKTYDTVVSPSNDFGPFLGGVAPMPRRIKRSVWWPYPIYYGGSDATAIFKNAGVLVFTDALVFKHKEPIRVLPPIWKGKFDKLGVITSLGKNVIRPVVTPIGENGGNRRNLKEPSRVRNTFPETWLWSTELTKSNGKAELMTTVPDTITSWVATAFAVNPVSGLGVAPTAAKFKVFRPFFISVNLPYSVVRGEHVTLQSIVFNYMRTDQQVQVTLAKSHHFYNIRVDSYGNEAMSSVDAVQSVMVKAGEAKSVYFPIVPATLGKTDISIKAQSYQAADALRRQLLVEAEGVPKEYNIPMMIQLGPGGQFSKTVDLTMPANTVTGSELVKVSAIGDIMGPSISGIDNLLRMPTGCGEQTMIGLAPDVYVTDYLTSTNQLMGEVKDKALSYMEKGYQRELTYKHKDGSFSAFGDNDKSGSMWLTAFVCKVFHQAKAYIFVDDNVVKTAISWMISHQNTNGSFAEPGRVIHKNMQGNAANGASLTAFVTISFLENRNLFQDTSYASNRFNTALNSALAYLTKEVAKSNDLYLMAMASYAFQMAGSNETDQLLDRLDQMANHDGGLYHLHQPETKKATKGSWHSPNPTSAVDTEMTSYVLMTYGLRRHVAFGRKIMQWVIQQRNSNGGFSSTQDTVVALNALSIMAEQLYSKNFNMDIDVAMGSVPTYSFQINAGNSAVLQRRENPNIPAQVRVDAKGTGTALVEIAVFFNVESEVEDTTFDLQVMLLEETMNRLQIRTCASWLGEGDASGMAVQEIGIPSGFQADLESFPAMSILKRKETQDKKVILYFDEIGTNPVCLSFVAERIGLVSKSQPAAIRVYDYYEPDNQVTGFYQSQLLKDSKVCDVCKECDGCLPRKG